MAFTFVFLPPQSETTRDWAAHLRQSVPEAAVVVAETVAEARDAIGDADAAFGTLPPELLAVAGRLRWLQAPAAAPPAGYYYPALVRHPVVVTNFRGIYNDISPRISWPLCWLSRGGCSGISRASCRAGGTTGADDVLHLPACTALIVGVGGIGGETARLCAAFGMRVVGVDARREDLPPGVAELHPPDALDRLLPEADFVILTVPHTPETEGMMHAARFRRMKPSAILINIGRGMTVRLDDLDRRAAPGIIGGAGLDVSRSSRCPPIIRSGRRRTSC